MSSQQKEYKMARNLLSRDIKKDISPLARKLYALIRAANFDYIKDFEKAAGVRPDSIRRLIGGYTKSLPYADLEKAAKALKLTINDLMSSVDGDELISTGNLVPGAISPCWFQVHSDEMSPTLKNGDNVLVDVGVRKFTGAGIYLIGAAQNPAFRRISLSPIDGRAKVDVDNKSYAYTEDADLESLSIQGRVIGIFHRI